MEKNELKVLKLLSDKYPNMSSALAEVINLTAISSLPKGTEHFMSDLHGEEEAFNHIMNNCSGVIKEKIQLVFKDEMSDKEKQTLATLIYYPKEKLKEIKSKSHDLSKWYKGTIIALVEICKIMSSKYSRSRVRKLLPTGYEWLMDELLHADHINLNREEYNEKIIDTIISLERQDSFIVTMATLIKNLAVDRLHIVGDIFDRGGHPDAIIDLLMRAHSCDVQWGNHDIVWMGASSGSLACIANVLNLSLSYNNVEVLEVGYGISLRPLATFAKETYDDVSCFLPKGTSLTENEIEMAQMRKAIAVIMFKLEGEVIMRNDNFEMSDRLLLNNIDFENGEILLSGKKYPLLDKNFPTINRSNPYELSKEENQVISKLAQSFSHSERLKTHIRFLYEKGAIYAIINNNLLYHGGIPIEADGSFSVFKTDESAELAGKAFMDYCDKMARLAFYSKEGSKEKLKGQDFCWYLWCGKKSPLFGREKMTTFERLLIEDKATHVEKKNAYYSLYDDENTFYKIAKEFSLCEKGSHIINGHVPVKSLEGESPLKANGRIIVIDGGFCKAYHKETGIAGYTLIYNSWGMRLSAHTPFTSKESAIKNNEDIHSTVNVFERLSERITIAETDTGKEIADDIEDLKKLAMAYKNGEIKENTKST